MGFLVRLVRGQLEGLPKFRPRAFAPQFATDSPAARLLNIEPWKSATAIKVNPDSV
jgi:hypothetical protein